MNNNRSLTENEQAKKVDKLQWDVRHWKSTMRFVEDEILFIERLLNSYVFEPNTPNLFERLQDYRQRLKKAKNRNTKLALNISRHKNNLGGMLECKDEDCDLGFYRKHDVLKAGVTGHLEDFQNLKAEIFNYAGAILKKRKPKRL